MHSWSPPHLKPGAVPIGLRNDARGGFTLSLLPPSTRLVALLCRASAISLERTVTKAKVLPFFITSHRRMGAAAAATAAVRGGEESSETLRYLTSSAAWVP